MAFYNKIKWVLGILIVFVIIVATNLIDRNNFLQVKDSIITIYEDRLVVNDLIFEISRSIHEKEIATVTADSVFFLKENNSVNKHIESIILRYQQTRLTVEEEKIFNNLKTNLQKLKDLEAHFIQFKFTQKELLLEQLAVVKEELYQLTKIQLDEGGRQLSLSKKAVDTVELFTQLEIYMLILLAIIIQVIVIYKPKEK